MLVDIVGSWELVAWRRIEGATVTYPLGADATGILIYSPDHKMAVQMVGAKRALIATSDALGGTVEERAAAYSTCLAYFGTYEVQGEAVVHKLDASLFPNWSGTLQSRPFSYDGKVLILRTPPVTSADGTVVNEISWARAKSY